nr:unnamed protein product [Digitaria exilis]
MGYQQQQMQGMSVGGDLKLPPGFRFHPSDEEIITFYLTPKVHKKSFTCTFIGEVDLNMTEPWELPGKAKIGEKEWYFFYHKDHKYRTGTRMNRATKDGYWKATGKDKEIYRSTKEIVLPVLVGMKKTLVFYMGRAPSGQKTTWIMHEYRLEGNYKVPYPTSISTSTTTVQPSSASEVVVVLDEWVVCRVFHKTRGVKKAVSPPPYNNGMTDNDIHNNSNHVLPPLQFPMLPDFTMDPAESYNSTIGMSSSLMLPVIPPIIASMVNAPVVPPISLYHQMSIGTTGGNGFMDAPESEPSFMVPQKGVGMSLDQINATDISSMVSVALGPMATMDMDEIWKY